MPGYRAMMPDTVDAVVFIPFYAASTSNFSDRLVEHSSEASSGPGPFSLSAGAAPPI